MLLRFQSSAQARLSVADLASKYRFGGVGFVCRNVDARGGWIWLDFGDARIPGPVHGTRRCSVNRRHRFLLFAVALLGIAGTVTAWRLRQPSPISVGTLPVRRIALEIPFVVDGEVDAVRSPVAPSEPAQVLRLMVREGEEVDAGQAIAELDRRDADTALAEAEAMLDAARSEHARAGQEYQAGVAVARRQKAVADAAVVEARSRLRALEAPVRPELIDEAVAQRDALASQARIARDEAERAELLFSDGAISRLDRDRAQARSAAADAQCRAADATIERLRRGAVPTELRVAQAAVDSAKARQAEAVSQLSNAIARKAERDAAQARVRAAEAARRHCLQRRGDRWLRSPSSGRIARIHVEPGAQVGPSIPVVTIVDNRTNTVVALVPDDQAALVEAGQSVAVTAPAFPGRVFSGTVLRKAPSAELRTDTAGRVHAVRTRIRLGPDARALMPGMEVDVSGAWKSSTLALVVPDAALVFDGGNAFVWKVSDGRSVRVPVSVGLGTSAGTAVDGQLAPGDAVVVSGKDGLTSGRSVVAQPALATR